MLERIKHEKTVDMYGCVKALRTQRNFMVQTEDQYSFVHAALLEAIDAGNTEVPARNMLAHVKKLRLMDTAGGSGMELEFKVGLLVHCMALTLGQNLFAQHMHGPRV